MDIDLGNGKGSLKQVPTGLSWTGFFFTGFVMLARGMTAKGIAFLAATCCIQVLVLGSRVALFPGDVRKAAAVAFAYSLAAFTPSLLCLFRLNRWTLEHWLRRGYAPVTLWRSDEHGTPPSGRAGEPWITFKNVAGFALVLVLFTKLVSAMYTGSSGIIGIVKSERVVSGWTRQAVLETLCWKPRWREFLSRDGVRRVEFMGFMSGKRLRLRFAVSPLDRRSELECAQFGPELIANARYPAVETNWGKVLSSRLGSELAAQRSIYYLEPIE
jgi:hypothetical protein